ncbi:MAG TPA: PhnD/SsuA/transferrin family substrate-binding protein [Polyangia bacterium]|jgi:ABC-type phosphate/phosphonate transport system substrate-binding protein
MPNARSRPGLVLGAVAYDPKVVTIWEEIRAHIRSEGVPLDVVFFLSYEQQEDALVAGHIDVSWSSPLAHVRIQRRTEGRAIALAMRDTDRDVRSRVVVAATSPVRAVADLDGRRLAVGARDSAQARLLPLHLLAEAGLDLRGVTVVPHELDLGMHGDRPASERAILRAIADGNVDAGCVGEPLWIEELSAGRGGGAALRTIWTSPPYDHCVFDAAPAADPALCQAFAAALFAMSWDDPRHRRALELEGLHQWLPARDSGYAPLRAALARFPI